MEKKVLLFEFADLGLILRVRQALAALDIGVECIPRAGYALTMKELAGGVDCGTGGAALGGQMAVLCIPMEQVQAVLGLLRGAGVGQTCLKAVLTPHNQKWTPTALYKELVREHRAMGGR